MTQKGRERTLVRAEGSVLFRHTLSFDEAFESVFADGQTLVLTAIRNVFREERSWEIVRIDREGNVIASARGALPATDQPQPYAPTARPRRERVAFEMSNADTWVVGFDGASELIECEQRTALGPADAADWIGAELKLRHGTQHALVNLSSGECLRIPDRSGISNTTFLHGRFQYAWAEEFAVGFFDRGPEDSEPRVPFAAASGSSPIQLLAPSDDFLYVMAAPGLTRYDLLAREPRPIELPTAVSATAMEAHGPRIVGFAGALPIWSFDVTTEIITPIDAGARSGAVSTRTSADHILLSIDQRPSRWISLESGEQRPFEHAIPEAAALEFIESKSTGLVIADGLPVAHFDVATGTAREVVLERSGEAATIADGSGAIVVMDGVPAFRVDVEDGEISEIGGVAITGEASTQRVGTHLVVSEDGVPSALLDRDAGELVPLSSTLRVPSATRMIANERHIVGLDQRDWPVFRIDSASRTVSGYAVREPSDLVSLRDERYVEAPGDATYQEFYAPAIEANGVVLEDGSIALVLRDARQARLWSVTPDDTAFQPLGRPFSGVVNLDWSVSDHFFQVGADRGECFCMPPKLRWDGNPDADVMPVGAVQMVARAHASLVIVRNDYLVEADASGACVVESAIPPRVHDLVSGTTLALEGAEGNVRFLQP